MIILVLNCVKWKSVYVRLKGSTSWKSFLYSLEILLLTFPKAIALNTFLGILGIPQLFFQHLGYQNTSYDWALTMQHLLTVHKHFAKTIHLVGTVFRNDSTEWLSQMLNLLIQLNLAVHKDKVVENQLSSLNFTAGFQLKTYIADGAVIAAYWYLCLSLRNLGGKKTQKNFSS